MKNGVILNQTDLIKDSKNSKRDFKRKIMHTATLQVDLKK
jgi:hypothetical protein